MENFVKYCKCYIIDHIYNYEGRCMHLCDLGLTLTEGPNADGTLTYSTYKAMEYLKEWWDDAAEYFEYEKSNFGAECVHNPFENPEAYMVCMVIEGVNALIGRAVDGLELQDQWNEEVELTKGLIDQIVDYVEHISEIDSLF